jgi:predicted nucleotidyltransferase
MNRESVLSNDRILPKVNKVIENCSLSNDVEVLSIILFGSKASGDRNSLNDYEFLIIVGNQTDLETYIQFNNSIRLETVKARLSNVKILVFTPTSFENILYKDVLVGTYLYIISRENIILLDKENTFAGILSRISRNFLKPEEIFLEQCISFAKELGSEKWLRKWEKALLQLKYQTKRKNGTL